MNHWTEEQKALLRLLWPNHTAKVIAARMGITDRAVIGKAHSLKLPIKIASNRRRGISDRKPLVIPCNRPSESDL